MHTYVWVWRQLRRYGWLNPTIAVAAMVLVVARAVLEGASLVLLVPLLDVIQSKGMPAADANGAITRLAIEAAAWAGIQFEAWSLSALIFVMIALREVVNYVSVVFFARLTAENERLLRRHVLTGSLRGRPVLTDQLGTGAFVELASYHCRASGQIIDNLIEAFSVVVTCLAYGSVLVLGAPLVALGGIGILAFVLLLVTGTVRNVSHLSHQQVATQQTFTRHVGEWYACRRLIKLAMAEDRERGRADQQSAKLVQMHVAIARAGAVTRSLIIVAIMGVILAGLVVLARMESVTLSLVTAGVLVIMRVLPLALSMARIRQAIANRTANLDRVVSVIRTLEAAEEPECGSLAFTGLNHAIEFRSVTIRYPGTEQPSLDGVDLTIPARQVTALVGPSGAGKSTLVDLLPRLIDPSEGEIMMDGHSVTDFSLASLRSHIAFMPQHVTLMDDSVTENVRYFRPEASLEDVQKACRLAHADEFIERLPEGYETRVGEGGIRLSGGQRQRLALARALMCDASILILDEPTSAIDAENEKRIQDALDELVSRTDMTVIVIAHRLSTIQRASHLIVLEKGRIIQQGNPAELRNEESWYSKVLRESLDPSDGN